MTCCCGTDSVDEQSTPLLRNKPPPKKPLVRKAPVRLEDANNVNVQLPPVYYVIVGRGPMAVVNHRTLRASEWGKARLAALKVLHLGFPNPWPKYLKHGLGQPNHLLSLPGFTNQPSAAGPEKTVDGGLDSQHFGGCVDDEYAALKDGFAGVESRDEWVALVQARTADDQAPDAKIGEEIQGAEVLKVVKEMLETKWPKYPAEEAPYRLCVVNPKTKKIKLVYAAAIDICTGPGRPRVGKPGDGDTPEIKDARTPPWLPPELWTKDPTWLGRRTLNGVDAIRDEVSWKANERICVTAGGGVGLNAAEKARNNSCVLDWFGRSGLMPIFDNPRNLTFLAHPETGARLKPGKRADVGVVSEAHLLPLDGKLRMGLGAVLKTIANNDEATKVNVTLSAHNDKDAIRDKWKKSSRLDSGHWTFSDEFTDHVKPLVPSKAYDRLVIPNGQETKTVGQPYSFAHHLTFKEVLGDDGRLVALETADGLVRVVGAAANNYPTYTIGDWTRATKPADGSPAFIMWSFHATLPVSAVPDGFIVCGVNTAAANKYFVDFPNKNVNTMTYAEILAVVGKAELAVKIVEGRNANNGYKDLVDLQTVAESTDAALKNFLYAYV